MHVARVVSDLAYPTQLIVITLFIVERKRRDESRRRVVDAVVDERSDDDEIGPSFGARNRRLGVVVDLDLDLGPGLVARCHANRRWIAAKDAPVIRQGTFVRVVALRSGDDQTFRSLPTTVDPRDRDRHVIEHFGATALEEILSTATTVRVFEDSQLHHRRKILDSHRFGHRDHRGLVVRVVEDTRMRGAAEILVIRRDSRPTKDHLQSGHQKTALFEALFDRRRKGREREEPLVDLVELRSRRSLRTRHGRRHRVVVILVVVIVMLGIPVRVVRPVLKIRRSRPQEVHPVDSDETAPLTMRVGEGGVADDDVSTGQNALKAEPR